MTVVYDPIPADGYEGLTPVDGRIDLHVGARVPRPGHAVGWRPFKVRIVRQDEETGRLLRQSDAPYMGDELVLRDRALSIVGPFLVRGGCEFLPLEAEGAKLTLISAPYVDALDVDKSTVSRFSSGRLMSIKQYAFYRDRLDGLTLFKIPNFKTGLLFMTEPLVRQWQAAKLTGWRFKRLWEG